MTKSKYEPNSYLIYYFNSLGTKLSFPSIVEGISFWLAKEQAEKLMSDKVNEIYSYVIVRVIRNSATHHRNWDSK
mgnify:CR=1 FL=1